MKRFFYLVASLFLLYSCSEDQTDMVQNENLADEVTFENSKLSLRQALSYASMFNPGMEKNDSPESLTRSVDLSQKLYLMWISTLKMVTHFCMPLTI